MADFHIFRNPRTFGKSRGTHDRGCGLVATICMAAERCKVIEILEDKVLDVLLQAAQY